MGENIYLKEDIIFNGGRIKLEGGKCLSLSTRILKRAIENFSMKEVKMKYPQL